MRKTQVDLLLDEYKNYIRPITKEEENKALSASEDEYENFTISIELTKEEVKKFIKYYNLTCLFEYLEDGVMITKHYPDKAQEYETYCKHFHKVISALDRMKNDFYNLMARKFNNHTVALYDFEDEAVGVADCDLMTRWAEDIDTQIKHTINLIDREAQEC